MKKAQKLIALAAAVVMVMSMTAYTAFAENEPVNTPNEDKILEEGAEVHSDTSPVDNESTDTNDDPEEPTTVDPTEPPAADIEEPVKTEPVFAAPAVSVKVQGPALLVSWNAVEDANGYEVYRSYSAKSRGTLLSKVTGALSYSDKAVASGKKAYYQVRAYKKDGSFSDYSAVASNTIYRVYIETGHGVDYRGRWDPGCTWKKYQEAKLMLPICRSMAKYLRDRGVYVYTDADKGNNTNLKWLVRNLKKYNVSVLVNVHCDYRKAPRGTLPLYRTEEQKKLAKALNTGVHKCVKIKNRGLKKRTNLECLNKTSSYCVSCLFETGNIKKDNKVLRKKYDAYGKGLAMGVCSYLGVKW